MKKIILSVLAAMSLCALRAEQMTTFKELCAKLESGNSIRVLLTTPKGDAANSNVTWGFKTAKFVHFYGANNFASGEIILINEASEFHADKVGNLYLSLIFSPDDLVKVCVKIMYSDNKTDDLTFTEKLGDKIKIFTNM